ncbi:MAG: hypothetical protein AB7U20_23025 [Planctomycetaceae bacterium]
MKHNTLQLRQHTPAGSSGAGADRHRPPGREAPGALRAVFRLCRDLLDAELEFYERLESLLTAMVTANLFSTEAATSLSSRMDDLQRYRDKLNHDRDECQQALMGILNPAAVPRRMAELEPLLTDDDRTELRGRRLLVVRRVEYLQKQLWRTDVLLASRHDLFSDLIAALTGQSTSANCYGATGRREHHVCVSVVETLS